VPPTGPRGPPLLRAGRRSLARLAPPRLPTLPLLLTCGKPSSALDPDTFSEGGGSCGRRGGGGGERVVSNLLFVSPLPAGFRLPSSPPSRAPHSPTRGSTWTRLRERGKGAETGVSGAGGRPPLAPWPLQPWTRRRVEGGAHPPTTISPSARRPHCARASAGGRGGGHNDAGHSAGGRGGQRPPRSPPPPPPPKRTQLVPLGRVARVVVRLATERSLDAVHGGGGGWFERGGGEGAFFFRERGSDARCADFSHSPVSPPLSPHAYTRAPWACEQTRARVPLRVRPRRHRTESETRDEARVPPRHHHGHPAAAAARPRGRGRV
jgi:hypothetical protein